MRVSFLGQPFERYGWTADWLNEPLSRENGGLLQAAVAWAKRSGLSQLQESTQLFRERGGVASVIIGIDEGGATKQGLELALETFDDVYIFHDQSSRTYHPKVYLLHLEDYARLIVGSNNMTAGGLFNNYEATLVCDLDLTLEEDQRLHQQVSTWFEVLRSDQVCKPLTTELLDSLISDPSYRIGDEDRPNRNRPQEREDYDGVTFLDLQPNIFGTSSSPKRGLAPRIRRPTPRGERRERPETPVPSHTDAPRGESLRWWKRMSAADAQHPANPSTNPTGSLKLTQAGHDIDQTTFFRYTMFGDANWASEQRSRGVLEEAVVPIDVVVEGTSQGRMNFKVDHAEYRVAGQGNVSTWLHWGDLREVLGRDDYTQAWVILERLSDGAYRLRIMRETPTEAS
jgi:hypothetical protein